MMSDEVRCAFSEIMDFDPDQREAYFLAHQTSREIRVEVERLLRFDAEERSSRPRRGVHHRFA